MRRHEACLPSTMEVSFEPPSPTPTIAGWQASPRLPKRDQRVEIEALDAVDAVAREQHAVVGAEQAALVHGGQVDPVGIGVEGVLDLRRVDADIVVVVGAPERMHAVGAQRHVVGRAARWPAAAPPPAPTGPPSIARLVADLDVPARQAGVAAHGAAVLLGGLVVLQHGLDDEGGEIALLGVGAAGAGRPGSRRGSRWRPWPSARRRCVERRRSGSCRLASTRRRPDLAQQRLARLHDG